VIFDEAGGGRGVGDEVGPRAGHTGGALHAVGDRGHTVEAQKVAAAAVVWMGCGGTSSGPNRWRVGWSASLGVPAFDDFMSQQMKRISSVPTFTPA
jgi:hypothetical protein